MIRGRHEPIFIDASTGQAAMRCSFRFLLVSMIAACAAGGMLLIATPAALAQSAEAPKRPRVALVLFLTEQNVKESLAQLTKDDVLITVDLEGFSVSDFDRMPAIAIAGEKSALKYADELARFSLSPQEYAALRARQITLPIADARPIDEIRVEGLHRVTP